MQKFISQLFERAKIEIEPFKHKVSDWFNEHCLELMFVSEMALVLILLELKQPIK